MELSSVRKNITTKITENRAKIFLFLKVIIAAGLLGFIVSSIKISEILTALENANYYLITIALVLLVPNIYLQYLKWKLTCKSILNFNDKKIIFYSMLQGFTAGAVTPLRLGEYFGRAFLFKERTLMQVTIATVVDKVFPMIILALIGSLSGIIFIYLFYNVSVYISSALFIVIFLLFYILIQLLIDPGFWDNFLFNKIKDSKTLSRYLGKLRFLKNLDRKYTLKMFFISFLFYSCFVLQFVILVGAFTNQINFIDYLWAAFLVMFAKTFFPAISLSELGIREGVSVFFLGEMGVAAASAFNASMFLFFINILIPALIGSVLLFRKTNA
jgi:hypothetical protein